MKNETIAIQRAANPFSDGVEDRHRRMGLLNTDGSANLSMIEAASRIHAGLFFDHMCDSYESYEQSISICGKIIEQAADASEKQILLMISMQYDTMCWPLPEVIWWISGSKTILPVFTKHFICALTELLEEGSVVM